MTAHDGTSTSPDTEPFLVMAELRGTRLQLTARSALAAAAVAQCWREMGAVGVDWLLRDDIGYERPVLIFTRIAEHEVLHATELVAGKPVSAHPETCCGAPLRWEVMQVCAPELAEPCPACLAAIRSAGLFSTFVPQPRGALRRGWEAAGA